MTDKDAETINESPQTTFLFLIKAFAELIEIQKETNRNLEYIVTNLNIIEQVIRNK